MNKRYCGFTLIELLVVIAIIALLLSIILPSLKKVKESTKTLICRTNIKQLAIAHDLYRMDHNNKAMNHFGGKDMWCMLLAPYMSDNSYQLNPAKNLEGAMKILFCPSTKAPEYEDSLWGSATNRWRYHWTDSTGLQFAAEASYGLNYWVGGWDLDALVAYGSITEEEKSLAYRDSSEARSDIPVFAESVWLAGLPKDNQLPPTDPYELIEPPMWSSGILRFCIDRHNMAINVSFADGHAESVKLGDLWAIKWNKTFKIQNLRVPFE
jgi:prepilin-type N-terminal cleavage/methylation domain-containing protein/prepilin-type processing-associated H-X9-DG protein